MTERIAALPEPFVMAVQLLLTGLAFRAPLRVRRPARCGACAIVFILLSRIDLGLSQRQDLMVSPLIIYLLFGLFLFSAFDADRKTLCFTFLAIVATQHMTVAVADTLRVAFRVSESSFIRVLISLLSFMASLSLCYLLYGRQMRAITQIKIQPGRLIALSCIIFALVYLLRVYSIMELWHMSADSPLFITLNLYDAAGSFAALAVLFAGNHEDTLLEEKRVIERMLREREIQERQIGETIDLVNMKYHDMKHLLSFPRISEQGELAGILEEMERGFPRYDRVLRTGSAPLDTVLMNKLVFCDAKHIILNCMADGEKLTALSAADVYALFGNLLDNAMEAAAQEPEDRRLISLKVFERRECLCIHIENTCSHPIEMEDGLPKTQKKDTGYHGFGMKSIRYITEKYGGNMTVTTGGGQFRVDILLPNRGR